MKNVFKFGFLGLALAVGVAACNNTATKESEETADSLNTEIQSLADSISKDLEAAGDSLQNLADSVGTEIKEVTE